ncbi:MAG: hypothetical protein K9J16_09790 [Melioribacteraceae bacterium]|nr:hypothetical protein [Melioribacteraceae bacterium]MCF8356104.1 hypothetical protein [Melioribacteraceae bacterium]MCF8395588.1 hypothetical protein [Melioribacteraceae bacterium]MCF8419690.1 hypothetical protein [Melioribacteraceae bacterium]
MDRKLLNTLLLLGIGVAIFLGGGFFTFFHQEGIIEEKTNKLEELKRNQYDTKSLEEQLNILKKRVAELDSILALRKFNIPVDLHQSDFFNFVNKVSYSFSPDSYVNIEYMESKGTDNFQYYVYTLNGTAFFRDFWSLVYAIEQSKQLKKIASISINNLVKVDENSIPNYMVNFSIVATTYFSDSDRFAPSDVQENNLRPNQIYDVFYPLIRNEIPPNTDRLLDVQTAKLLALIPEGAYLSDANGNTFLLWEGDEVYLGYLTKINYEYNEVSFILNKGGLIERVTLTLDGEKKSE